MARKLRDAELEQIAVKLTKVLVDETDIKKNCCISPEFRKVFFDDLRESGWHEKLIALCEYIIDN